MFHGLKLYAVQLLGAAAHDPVMVAVLVKTVPSDALPVGVESVMVKVLVPLKACVVLMGTLMVLGVASPVAQLSVPLVAV